MSEEALTPAEELKLRMVTAMAQRGASEGDVLLALAKADGTKLVALREQAGYNGVLAPLAVAAGLLCCRVPHAA